jgi:hypothetical protein
MGSPWGLPMASFSLVSGDLDEADRPDPKTVKKGETKKSFLSSLPHPQLCLQYRSLITHFFPYVNSFFLWLRYRKEHLLCILTINQCFKSLLSLFQLESMRHQWDHLDFPVL